MKKSIFAVLAVAAISSAQAQDSVTIYGLIDEGYLSIDKTTTISHGGHQLKADESQTGINSNNTSQSRIGLKTAEDLGNGNSLRAVLEFGLDPSAINTQLTTRQGYVALKNNEFGQIAVGRQQSKTHDFLLAADQSGSAALPGSIYYNLNKFIDRAQSATYAYNGSFYNVFLAYVHNVESNPVASLNGNLHAFEAGGDIRYQNVFGRAAYVKGSGQRAGLIRDLDAITGNIGYDFGFAKAQYTYHQTSEKLNSLYDGTARFHQVGVSAPVTPAAEVFANYVIGKGNGTFNLGPGIVANTSGRGFQIGSRYHFTKRTSVYGAYGQQTIDGDVAGGLLKADEKVKAYTVGLKHTF